MAASLMDVCRHGRVPEACDDCDQRAQAMAHDHAPVDPVEACDVCQGERGFSIVVRCPACAGTGAYTPLASLPDIFASLNGLTNRVAALRYQIAQFIVPEPAPTEEGGG